MIQEPYSTLIASSDEHPVRLDIPVSNAELVRPKADPRFWTSPVPFRGERDGRKFGCVGRRSTSNLDVQGRTLTIG